jgi:hypothetical protein
VADAAAVGAALGEAAGEVAAAPWRPVCVVSAVVCAFPALPRVPLTVQAISASTPIAAASAITRRRQ